MVEVLIIHDCDLYCLDFTGLYFISCYCAVLMTAPGTCLTLRPKVVRPYATIGWFETCYG